MRIGSDSHLAWIVIFRGMSSWLLLVSARKSDCYENHIILSASLIILKPVHVCEGEGVLPEQSRSFISENT